MKSKYRKAIVHMGAVLGCVICTLFFNGCDNDAEQELVQTGQNSGGQESDSFIPSPIEIQEDTEHLEADLLKYVKVDADITPRQSYKDGCNVYNLEGVPWEDKQMTELDQKILDGLLEQLPLPEDDYEYKYADETQVAIARKNDYGGFNGFLESNISSIIPRESRELEFMKQQEAEKTAKTMLQKTKDLFAARADGMTNLEDCDIWAVDADTFAKIDATDKEWTFDTVQTAIDDKGVDHDLFDFRDFTYYQLEFYGMVDGIPVKWLNLYQPMEVTDTLADKELTPEQIKEMGGLLSTATWSIKLSFDREGLIELEAYMNCKIRDLRERVQVIDAEQVLDFVKNYFSKKYSSNQILITDIELCYGGYYEPADPDRNNVRDYTLRPFWVVTYYKYGSRTRIILDAVTGECIKDY